nr:hypothetical protein Iba_chr12eCG7850 [Ipomoea batatas]
MLEKEVEKDTLEKIASVKKGSFMNSDQHLNELLYQLMKESNISLSDGKKTGSISDDWEYCETRINKALMVFPLVSGTTLTTNRTVRAQNMAYNMNVAVELHSIMKLKVYDTAHAPTQFTRTTKLPAAPFT